MKTFIAEPIIMSCPLHLHNLNADIFHCKNHCIHSRKKKKKKWIQKVVWVQKVSSLGKHVSAQTHTRTHTPAFLCVFSLVSVLNQRGSPEGREIHSTSSSCGSGTVSCCRWSFCTSWDGPLSCESSARGASQKAVQKKPEFRGQGVPGVDRGEGWG